MTAFYQSLVDNLHYFQVKPDKWPSSSERLPKMDDVVIFRFNQTNASTDWKIGRVVDVQPRKVTIMYSLKSDTKAIPTMKFAARSYRDIVIVFSEDDIYLNSNKYFEQISK